MPAPPGTSHDAGRLPRAGSQTASSGGAGRASSTRSPVKAPGRAPMAPVRFRFKDKKAHVGVADAAHRAHHYSPEEQSKLASFQSISYLPLHTKMYREWLKNNWSNSQWEHWVMMAIVGIATGLAGAFLRNCIQFFTELKFKHVAALIEKDFGLMWFYVVSVSVLLALGAASVIVFFEPAAAGSGVPEVMAYLNGVSIPKVFGFRTLVAKYTSVALAVASGLYGGNEGPMIHIGASLGKVLSQGFETKGGKGGSIFKRFRNMYDRRNFISAGAAAGVASAFNAPVGGLLFVLEEISSFWSHRLAWETFFCCMLSTITTELINNSFQAFRFTGQFGLFTNHGSYAFYVNVAMKSQLYMFFPTVILGILGGLAGVLFTWINLKVCKFRNRWIARIRWRRVTEVVLVAFITTTLAVCLPAAFKCMPVDCQTNPTQAGCTARLIASGMEEVEGLHRYTCAEGFYNPAATLFFTSGEKTIEHLFSRNTHYQLDYGPLCTLVILYFLLACYTSGMAQASGIMVPSLLIGAALGRLFGLILTDIAGGPMGGPDMDWIDPGVFALIGCAAFFAGVTRLTMSLTVIMIEITNETHFLLPVMTAVVVAKLTADCCMESLYHCLIQFKCLPYLADELHAHVCLELHAVKEVMSNPAVSLPVYGSVAEIASLMVGNNHSAFPVTEKGTAGPVFKGTILRNHVTCILAREDLFVVVSPNAAKDAMERQESLQIDETNKQRYNVLGAEELANLDDKLPKFQISATDTGDREAMIARLTAPEFRDLYVNLSPYVDQSSYSVPETFSLERGYNLFRSMGLRHITVVDKFNFPVGMLSRKDLLHLNVEERMAKSKEAMQRKRTVTKELIDRARSNSLSLNPVSPPVWNTGVTPNSQQASPFSPVVNLDGSV